MSRKSNEELIPRNGRELKVLAVGRISGCQRQKELSLDDQTDNVREFIADIYPDKFQFDVIATKGKGESLDRPELEKIEQAYRSGKYDMVGFDDLSRLVRGGDAVRLLGIGVDNGTRSICISDGIDTADETWEEDALNASSENVAHNERTSRRIKQKTMNRFKKFGFTPKRAIAGYIVPEGVKSFDEWLQDASAKDWIQAGRLELLKLKNYTAVADFLNARGVPVGPYCRKVKTWNGAMVRRFYSNTLLKGKAARGYRHSVKKHATGRRVPVVNPKGPNFYDCAHLAYFTEAEFDESRAVMAEITESYRVGSTEKVRDRHGVPRKRTRFPGQFARCWYCGRPSVWGGNGRTNNLMCNGARSWECWNSYGYNGALAARNIVDCILRELTHLEGFDAQYRAMVDVALAGNTPRLEEEQRTLEAEEAKLRTERANVQVSLRQLGPKPLVLQAMADVETLEASVQARRRAWEAQAVRPLDLPQSVPQLRALLEEEFKAVAQDTPDFNVLLQTVVSNFYVYLVRLCNGGGLFARAKVTLALDGIKPDLRRVCDDDGLLRREVTIDLFEAPERERIRPLAANLAAQGHGPKAIAALIAEQTAWRPKPTAVQNALKLHKSMLALGLTSPYVTLTAPPEGYQRMRRYQHERYQFAPLEGYVPPPL